MLHLMFENWWETDPMICSGKLFVYSFEYPSLHLVNTKIEFSRRRRIYEWTRNAYYWKNLCNEIYIYIVAVALWSKIKKFSHPGSLWKSQGEWNSIGTANSASQTVRQNCVGGSTDSTNHLTDKVLTAWFSFLRWLRNRVSQPLRAFLWRLWGFWE